MYKAIDVARWFLRFNESERRMSDDVEGISNLKLQKLLYYAQGCYLALYGIPLFEDEIIAWQHGPVVIDVYHEYKEFHANVISKFDAPSVGFDANALDVMEWVYREFGQYTAWALRDKTHREAPWRETEITDVIGIDKIKKYFLENYVENEA